MDALLIFSVKTYKLLSILCDLHFILERRKLNSMDVNQRKAVTVFFTNSDMMVQGNKAPKIKNPEKIGDD